MTDFINNGKMEPKLARHVRVRIGWKVNGFVFLSPWSVFIDWIEWRTVTNQ
jgi:hypothetical protein